MLFYIARQPIFDQLRDIVAYELLYRNSNSKTANITDADDATIKVLMGSTLIASFEELVNNKRAFINFTKNLILDDTPLMFSKEYMTVEILEDIIPDDAFIEKLLSLKAAGYTLALDDFTTDYPYSDIVDIVDVLKVDFLLTTPEEQAAIIKKYKRPGLKFLAEKVETLNEFNRAKALGYTYFQGYYFSKPSVFQYKDISSIGVSNFEMIKVLESPNPNYSALSSIVETDVSLTYKLFKYANSPIYGGAEKISTIRGALVRLGFANLKRWVYLVVLRGLSIGQSDDLVAISLQRAKFLDLMATNSTLHSRAQECFLVGLFSMLDILMNKPIEAVLEELPLPAETKEAIISKSNSLGEPLKLAISYEKGDWSTVEDVSKKLKLNSKLIPDLYLESLHWATETIAFTN